MGSTWLRTGLLPALMLWIVGPAMAETAQPRPPLYPRIFVATDDSLSLDPELAAFRAAADKASEALTMTPDGQAYDPGAMLPLLADSVEIFTGRSHFLTGSVEFESRGKLSAAAALQMLGNLTEPGPPIVEQRRGMGVIAQLLWDPVIGRTPWLDGRICTASYGRLAPEAFAALVESTRIAPDDWLVTGRRDPGAPGAILEPWPRAYQLVPRSGQQRRDGGWTGVLTPEGETVHFRDWPWDPRFAPYLNSHLCFVHEAGGWKISAVALRLA